MEGGDNNNHDKKMEQDKTKSKQTNMKQVKQNMSPDEYEAYTLWIYAKHGR